MQNRNRKFTELTLTNSSGNLRCRIRYEKAFRFIPDSPPGPVWDPETAAYAVFRYLRHCPVLRDTLVWNAVRLGLRTGRAGKVLRRRVSTKASALRMPGGEALIALEIGQGTITIKSLRLYGRPRRPN